MRWCNSNDELYERLMTVLHQTILTTTIDNQPSPTMSRQSSLVMAVGGAIMFDIVKKLVDNLVSAIKWLIHVGSWLGRGDEPPPQQQETPIRFEDCFNR